MLRVDCTPTELETALADLARDGFVALTSRDVRLTLAGLAVSVAAIAPIVAPLRVARARTAA